MIGLYVIVAAGKLYVGSSARMKARWEHHVWVLKRGRHSNPYLQRVWDKHGESEFQFTVLHAMPGATPEALVAAERDAIRILEPEFNLNPEPGLPPSVRPEVAAKISAALKGRKLTPEHRANIIAGRAGYKHSDETKAKIGAAKRGQKHTQESRDKISRSSKGKPWSEARRRAHDVR